MRRIRIGVPLVVVLAMAACSPEPSREPVAEFLSQTLPDGPGGTVVAGRGERIVHCEGFGMADREERIAATCDTAYDVMSISKQFTAAAILKLEMTGELRVTDPISTHLGPVPGDKRGITLHHLLTHTAGLVEALGDDYAVLSRDAMLAEALASTPLSAPGAEFRYSNVGYSVLAAIVEKVSGLGYEQFMARYLFAPAGMTSTGYVLPRWERDQVAVEYDAGGASRGRPDERPWAADGPYWNLRGNGGLLSTARDMFRWHRALTGDTVLSASARAKLFAPSVPVPDSAESYAYGWGIVDAEDGRIAFHDGGNDWALATYARSVDDSPDDAVMTFWVSNHAYREPGWNLEDMATGLTLGILERVRSQPS
ncbi:beta-lactamase family protein [Pseudonocardia sp. DSM 110487]|uniref:serine hydrolase domain-containing protein n=1 Tax=Pseudonocardia sp. DSM 110487 TaxID=2865833 RepID=UPI001C6A044A|nr:serine hydrolase domain-containing protein [Pseudonocardia sp. DSM 110487]QYN34081.1 beta-lactamase family protein [Pseudonocardia sp. DSM 110487]